MDNDISSGYGFNPELNTVYHFAFIAPNEIIDFPSEDDWPFVVETVIVVNKKAIQTNVYFAKNLDDATYLISKLRPIMRSTPEKVCRIRPATDKEITAFKRAKTHFATHIPPPISDNEIEKE